MVGAAVSKVVPKREWTRLGIVLGSMAPDLDGYAMLVATVARPGTHGLHRTFTHSLFTILATVAVFLVIAQVSRQPRWANLGLGVEIGIGMHMALDLLVWFDGVELLWPMGGWVNLWEGVRPPEWFTRLLDPSEFLFFGEYFAWLAKAARRSGTNPDFLGPLRLLTVAMVVLLAVFTPLSYTMAAGFLTIYGVFFLLSITVAFVTTIRMRETVAPQGGRQ